MNQKFRLVFIGLGLSLTGTAGLLLYVQSKNDASRVQMAVEAPKILVFTRDLPAGHILTSGDVRWRALGNSPAPEGSILKAKQSEVDLLGAPLKLPVMAGQLVRLQAMGAKPSDALLSSKLNPGYRAVTISVDGAQLVSGRLLPNDRVDLVLTPGASQGGSVIPMPSMPSSQPNMVGVTRILDNVRVIAIGGATEPEKPESGQMETSMLKDATVTLELRPEEARRVLAANALGKIALLLRRPLDPDAPMLGRRIGERAQGLPPLPSASQSPGTLATGATPAVAGASPATASETPSVIIVRGSN